MDKIVTYKYDQRQRGNTVFKLSVIFCLGILIYAGLFIYIMNNGEKNILYYVGLCINLINIGMLIYMIVFLILDCINMRISISGEKITYRDYLCRKSEYKIDEIVALKTKTRNQDSVSIIFPSRKMLSFMCNEIIDGNKFKSRITRKIEYAANDYEMIKIADEAETRKLIMMLILMSIGMVLPSILT